MRSFPGWRGTTPVLKPSELSSGAGSPNISPAKLDELGVLHVAVHAADGDVQEARQAVEESQAQHVELEEAHHGREQQVRHAGALAELVGLARGQRGVA